VAVVGVWGQSPQLPEANGGLGAKPQPLEARGLGAKTPALGDFYDFSTKIMHF